MPETNTNMEEDIAARQSARELRQTELAELKFYNQGKNDFVSGNRDTEAARAYLEYWRNQPQYTKVGRTALS